MAKTGERRGGCHLATSSAEQVSASGHRIGVEVVAEAEGFSIRDFGTGTQTHVGTDENDSKSACCKL